MCQAWGWTDILKKDRTKSIHGYHLSYHSDNDREAPCNFDCPEAYHARKYDCILCKRDRDKRVIEERSILNYVEDNKLTKVVEMMMPPLGHKRWSLKSLKIFNGEVPSSAEDDDDDEEDDDDDEEQSEEDDDHDEEESE